MKPILKDRGYVGEFAGRAATIQYIKHVMRCTEAWPLLASSQKEALDMIAHKIGRILGGQADVKDNWDDIAGYAELVALEMAGKPVVG